MNEQRNLTAIIQTKQDGQRVMTAVEGLIAQYGHVTAADFLELVGSTPVLEDSKWGWKTTDAWEIRPHPNGWVVITTEPDYLPGASNSPANDFNVGDVIKVQGVSFRIKSLTLAMGVPPAVELTSLVEELEI